MEQHLYKCAWYSLKIAHALQDLVKQAPEQSDVWMVDTACLVPMTLFKKGYAKAYAFRTAHGRLRDERLKDLPYPSSHSPG